MFLNYFSCIPWSSGLSTSVLFVSPLQLVNGAQFFNMTYLLFLPAATVSMSASYPTIVMVPFISM